MQQAQANQWLTVNEFIRLHPNLGKSLVYESVRDGRLRSIRLGGKILIASDALDLLVEDEE